MNLPEPVASRLVVTDMGYETPCLVWCGTIASNGYGVISIHRKQYKVHRVTYAAATHQALADLDPSLVIDHLCRVRSCANADHLELVTDRINVLRGVSFAASNSAKTHCQHGHPFTEENTSITTKGHRACLTCRRQAGRVYDATRRANRRAVRSEASRVRGEELREARAARKAAAKALREERRRVEPMILGLPARFWAKVVIDHSGQGTPCLIWTGAHNGRGYGRIGLFRSRAMAYVHRMAYEVLVGPIPEGSEVKHLCRKNACVNHEHLYLEVAATRLAAAFASDSD